MHTKSKGDRAESRAAAYLQQAGFTVIERNYFAKKLGEIDIIAKKEGVLHFVEVKSGIGFDPVYNLTPSKLAKVIRSAQLYMKQHRTDTSFCIDACIVRGDEIDFLENITL